MEWIEGFKILLEGGFSFALACACLWFIKRFYEDNIEGKINHAVNCSVSAKEEAEKAHSAILSAHAHLAKATEKLYMDQAKHWAVFSEVQAFAKNADENVQKLHKLTGQLAQRTLLLETEIKQLKNEWVFVKNKKQ